MTKRFRSMLLALAGMLVMFAVSTAAFAQSPTLVVFSASWCASCRDVVPIVQQVASSHNMRVVVIDVDRQDAPKQAQSYSLTIPTSEPPQVYMVNNGRVKQVYNGKDFRFGYEDMVRSTLEQNIQGR